MNISTALANSNIAIIKYWGNRNTDLFLPYNSSISFTMDDKLQTKTTVMFDEEFTVDELWINDEKAKPHETQRVSMVLDLIRKQTENNQKAKVYSTNSFPKGAGLASSASSFAALAAASTKALGLNLSPQELSIFARFGSGSATRSVLGGAVQWNKGEKEDGSDCVAEQLAPKENFPNLRNVIAITEKEEKKVGSREGMARTVSTCGYYPQRLKEVEGRLETVRDALLDFNFQKLAPVIMEESDSMHRSMRESNPPLIYLNETSHKIMNAVKELNSQNDEYVGTYTFDAGPNAHIYTLDKHAPKIVSLLKEIEGVKEVLTCSVGGGVKYTESHLM